MIQRHAHTFIRNYFHFDHKKESSFFPLPRSLIAYHIYPLNEFWIHVVVGIQNSQNLLIVSMVWFVDGG